MLFPILDTHAPQYADLLEQLSRSGKSIPILRYSYELNELRPGDIVQSTWGQLLFVSDVLVNASANSQYTFLQPKIREMIQSSYGRFDIIILNPVCGIVFFNPTSRFKPPLDIYSHCGVIVDNMVYESWDLLTKSITSLEDKTSDFIAKKSVFIPHPVDLQEVKHQLHLGPNPIEFVSRVTGYSRKKQKLMGGFSRDGTITTYKHLYYFLKSHYRRNPNVQYKRISGEFFT